jgi:hypothetical protein
MPGSDGHGMLSRGVGARVKQSCGRVVFARHFSHENLVPEANRIGAEA